MLPPYYELTLLKAKYLPPDFPALICGKERVNWKRMADRVNHLANALKQRGVKKGDMVAFMFYNRPEFVEATLASQALGAVPVPVNYRYVAAELEYVLNNCEAKAFLFHAEAAVVAEEARKGLKTVKSFICHGADFPTWADNYERVLAASSSAPVHTDVTYDDTAVIIYTGGTTGFPKGVVLSYGNIQSNQEAVLIFLITLLPSWNSKGAPILGLQKKMQAIAIEMFTAVQNLLSSPSFEGKVVSVELRKQDMKFPSLIVESKNGGVELYSGKPEKADMELVINVKESLMEFLELEIFSASWKGKMKVVPRMLKMRMRGEMQVKAPFALHAAMIKGSVAGGKGQTPNKVVVAPPMFHLASFSIWLNYMNYPFGTTIFTESKSFEPAEVFSILQTEKPRALFLVPTMWKMFLSHQGLEKCVKDSMHLALSGAAVMDVKTKKTILANFKNAIVMDAFGQTEMAPAATVKVDGDEHELKSRSVGKPLPNIEIRIVGEDGKDVNPGETGEVWYRGPNVMKGYLRDEEKTKEVIDKDGWFRSGDLGYFGEDGELYTVERKSECINTGGEKVYPLEVEEIIAQNPKVAMAVVVGLPDETWGESVAAMIVLKDGERAAPEEIIAWCDGKMAGYKKPKAVKFVKEIPLTPVGKVQRKTAKEMMAGMQTAGN